MFTRNDFLENFPSKESRSNPLGFQHVGDLQVAGLICLIILYHKGQTKVMAQSSRIPKNWK